MMLRDPKLRHLAAFSLALLVSACTGSSATPAAKVRGVAGSAEVRAQNAAATPALQGQALFPGDVVQTGDDGAMTIEFQSGNVIELLPNTTIEIGKEGAAGTTVGAIVIDGEAKARSSGGGEVLRIGLAFENRILEIGTGPVEILLGEESVEVLVGTIEVIGEDGQREAVEAGEVFQVGGVVIEADEEEEEDAVLEAEPVVITLLSNPRFTQLKRAGESTWSRPKKSDTLQQGDTIRTRRRGAIMAFDDASRVVLDSDSEITVGESKRDGERSGSSYTLASGGARVRLRSDEQAPTAEHAVSMGATQVLVKPGARDADVALKATADGRGRVEVQLGQAELADGTKIGPGQAVSIENGAATAEPGEIAVSNVQLRTGLASVVYYASTKPPVVFSWKQSDGDPQYDLQLSRSKDFSGEPVFEERLSRTRFVYEKLDEGQYFWRVKAVGGEWKRGSFRVKKGSPSRCGKNCGRENRVRDTGVKTVVYFQQALPSITLMWDAMEGAANYRLKVFRDGEFERPTVDQTLKGTQRKFKAGQLVEGKYFWLVNALDEANKELRTGGTNGLEIKFDNSAVDI
ncbi:MAG: hypothetical protein AAFQ82_09050, partial [Myxococcota bacterium]